MMKQLMGGLIYRKDAEIAPGICFSNIAFFDADGRRLESYVLTADCKRPEVRLEAALPDDGEHWGMQHVALMAKSACIKGNTVVGGINGDFYTMTSGVPNGVFVKNGKIIKATMDVGKAFFGVTRDGRAEIGNEDRFNQIKDSLYTAIGGRCLLVKDGEINNVGIDEEAARRRLFVHTLHPRTAVGIQADGKVLLVVVDGRQPGYSEGVNLWTLAEFLRWLGAVEAMNLDGGGSSTFVLRAPGESDVSAVNRFSDGNERPTANALLVMSTASSDGRFIRAYIEPSAPAVAPGGFVDFTARGIDASGFPAPLPENGLAWSMADPSGGSMEESRFCSSGKEGRFDVLLTQSGRKVGETQVHVVRPSTISFESGTECIQQPDAVAELRLTGECFGEKIMIQPHLADWSVAGGIGTVDRVGRLSIGSKNGEGTVTARLKGGKAAAQLKVFVGKLPVILEDFENPAFANKWIVSSVSKGASCVAQTVQYPEAPVRTGSASLRIDFSCADQIKKTAFAACVGPDGGALPEIVGCPSGIGMWVYASKEEEGLSLSGKLLDSAGKTIDLVYEVSGGILRQGWNYAEAAVPEDAKGPLAFCPGEAVILTSSVSTGITACVYLDNIRAVYGITDDDPHGPEIKSINVDGKTLDAGCISIVVRIEKKLDYRQATKINFNRMRLIIDGIDYTDRKGHYGINKGNNTVMLDGIEFQTGTHVVMASVQDDFGNEACRQAHFTVL